MEIPQQDLRRVAPLDGVRVAVTRPGAGSEEDRLSRLVRDAGGRPEAFPLTRIVPADDPGPLDRAIAALPDYDWLIVTSGRAVAPLADAFRRAGRAPAELGALDVGVCAVGPRTAATLRLAGFRTDLVPDEFAAGGVVEALTVEGDPAGLRILFPRSEEGRDEIPDQLEARGARVEVIGIYTSLGNPDEGARLREAVRAGGIDALTFTAGSAARVFLEAGPPVIPAGVGVFALGPATAEVLVGGGVEVDRIARPHSFEGLVSAIGEWAPGREGGPREERRR